MAQVRRPGPRGTVPPRVALLRLFLAIVGTFFFALFLFQFDAFPRQRAEAQRLRASSSAVDRPLLTPERLLAQDFIRQQEWPRQQKQPQLESAAVVVAAATETGAAAGPPRRFALHLAGLMPGNGTEADADAGPHGTVVLETRPGWAPLGAARLHELLAGDFYRGCRFFRVIPDFMAQFGIAADPAVQRDWSRRLGPLRDDVVRQTNARGTVSFATSGPDSRGTQLFINTRARGNAYLDKQGFAPVAVVLSGMEHVDRVYDGYREKPLQPRIQARGNAYLEEEFPLLSYIESVEELPLESQLGAGPLPEDTHR